MIAEYKESIIGIIKTKKAGYREMNWTTIYITGNEGFKEEVRRKLEHSELKYMPGNLGSSSDEGTDDLYWLDAGAELRAFKEAIGGKLVWKYRLRFFQSLEDFLAFQESRNSRLEFTPMEAV
jgi:hypothetical protein